MVDSRAVPICRKLRDAEMDAQRTGNGPDREIADGE